MNFMKVWKKPEFWGLEEVESLYLALKALAFILSFYMSSDVTYSTDFWSMSSTIVQG